MSKRKKKKSITPKKKEAEKAGLAAKAARFILSPSFLLSVIMLIALGFRLSNAIFTPLIYPDSLQYMDLSDDIRTGAIFSRDYDLDGGFIKSRHLPPFYSILLACFSWLPFEKEFTGGLISIVIGMATFVPLFLLGRRLVSPAAGLAAAAMFSFQWFGLRYATPLLTEPTFTFLYVCIIALSFQVFTAPTNGLLVLLGLLCGFSYLTRDVGITSVLWVLAGGIYYWRFISRASWRKIMARSGIILGVFVLVGLPYWVHIKVHTGEWGLTPQMGGSQLKEQLLHFGGTRIDRDKVIEDGLEGSDSSEGSFLGGESGLLVIPIKVVVLFKDYFLELFRQIGWLLTVLFFTGYILAGAHIIRSREREAVFREAFVLIWILQLVGIYALVTPYMVDERYMYPIVPLVLLIAGAGLVRSADRGVKILSRFKKIYLIRDAALSAAMVILLVVIVFVQQYPQYKTYHKLYSRTGMAYKYSAGHKEVAMDIRSRGLVPPGKVILGRKPFMAYYLKGEYKLMPKTYHELLKVIAGHQADYIIADSFVLNALRRLLEPMAFGFQPDPDAEIKYVSQNRYYVKEGTVKFFPVPGTRIIYSRYFPQYSRVITVCEIQPEQRHEEEGNLTVNEHLSAAREYMKEGYFKDALDESLKVLSLDESSSEAYFNIIYIFTHYYTIAPRRYLIEPVEKAATAWLKYNPESEAAREAQVFARKELKNFN